MKRFIVIFLLLLCVNAQAANEWQNGTGTNPLDGDTTAINDIDTQFDNYVIEPIERILITTNNDMHLTYNSAAQITATSGSVVCASASNVLKLRRNTSNTTVTWSDIDTGAEAGSTTYYVYANCDADATTATFKISTNSSTPSGVTYYKKIGSFYNDSSSNITKILNDKFNEFNTYTSKSVGTTYQALTDGVVVAVIQAGGTSSAGKIIGYTDSSSSPTTQVAGAFIWQSTAVSSISSINDISSMSFPVRAGDYYKVVLTNGAGSNAATASMYFVDIN